jgi:hypothetical protein
MKWIQPTPASRLLLAISLLAAPVAGLAAEKKEKAAKPYTLKKCVVSDEEIDEKGTMKPYAFVHGDRQIKLCCKPCLKDFQKDPAKYLKKIEEEEKKAKK